jgi:hypothetical protein
LRFCVVADALQELKSMVNNMRDMSKIRFKIITPVSHTIIQPSNIVNACLQKESVSIIDFKWYNRFRNHIKKVLPS